MILILLQRRIFKLDDTIMINVNVLALQVLKLMIFHFRIRTHLAEYEHGKSHHDCLRYLRHPDVSHHSS